jgi:pimeloyl-ACP methyl ester carboxylesterase
MGFEITEHVTRTNRHVSFYLACGPTDGPLVVCVHGWPELSLSWRHVLPALAAFGFRCLAPDMRGYGRSSVYRRHEDYALAESVQDMLELLDATGREQAIWIGHDWGSPVVWSLASHHPERCQGVVNLCVPYIAAGFAPANFLPLVDRAVYPQAEFSAGQWDYMMYYEESFSAAQAAMEADVPNTVRAMFRAGSAANLGKPSRTAGIRRAGGWFGGAGRAPAVPRDPAVLTEQDASCYAAALERNGFFGPNSWYMNHTGNIAFARQARNDGKLDLPVLFLHAAYDTTCETLVSSLAEPMRRDCSDLTEVVVASGHWMAQEQPMAVNAAIACWLATRFPELWIR